MTLVWYTCLFWLSTSCLWTIQAQDSAANVNIRSPHRGLAPTNVDFAFSLFKHLVSLAPDRNVFISPVSISIALAMLSLGTYGPTRTQLLQGLGFNITEISETEIHQRFQHLLNLLRESETSLEMTLGTTLFYDRSLEPLESFSADIKKYYESEVLAADFQDGAKASRQIKEYIKNKTQGEIEDLFSDVESPGVILVNYIFFKGMWAQPFDPVSRVQNFYVNETLTVEVPMLFQSSTIMHLYDPELACRVVKLDYEGNGTAFFILPDRGRVDTVISTLTRDTIQRWSQTLTSGQVNLYIPKFSISGAHDLTDVLTGMGIAGLFANWSDFSGITQEAPVKLSKVVHKATLQLDERGMKAAAHTEVSPEQSSEPHTILFNQPFVILVFDDFSWSSLFMGKVENPA
ncbi:Corticosteroid-binding globulin [Tupaia chinensis]|uniref:Corticosteroid-binding globulin n=1 Tax=Tupaia chinensis TaxID=246437 RepID=L8YAN0_TUPCH|nr:Corticosteroid-binding globulin [Tupaia chinensis]